MKRLRESILLYAVVALTTDIFIINWIIRAVYTYIYIYIVSFCAFRNGSLRKILSIFSNTWLVLSSRIRIWKKICAHAYPPMFSYRGTFNVIYFGFFFLRIYFLRSLKSISIDSGEPVGICFYFLIIRTYRPRRFVQVLYTATIYVYRT